MGEGVILARKINAGGYATVSGNASVGRSIRRPSNSSSQNKRSSTGGGSSSNTSSSSSGIDKSSFDAHSSELAARNQIGRSSTPTVYVDRSGNIVGGSVGDISLSEKFAKKYYGDVQKITEDEAAEMQRIKTGERSSSRSSSSSSKTDTIDYIKTESGYTPSSEYARKLQTTPYIPTTDADRQGRSLVFQATMPEPAKSAYNAPENQSKLKDTEQFYSDQFYGSLRSGAKKKNIIQKADAAAYSYITEKTPEKFQNAVTSYSNFESRVFKRGEEYFKGAYERADKKNLLLRGQTKFASNYFGYVMPYLKKQRDEFISSFYKKPATTGLIFAGGYAISAGSAAAKYGLTKAAVSSAKYSSAAKSTLSFFAKPAVTSAIATTGFTILGGFKVQAASNILTDDKKTGKEKLFELGKLKGETAQQFTVGLMGVNAAKPIRDKLYYKTEYLKTPKFQDTESQSKIRTLEKGDQITYQRKTVTKYASNTGKQADVKDITKIYAEKTKDGVRILGGKQASVINYDGNKIIQQKDIIGGKIINVEDNKFAGVLTSKNQQYTTENINFISKKIGEKIVTTGVTSANNKVTATTVSKDNLLYEVSTKGQTLTIGTGTGKSVSQPLKLKQIASENKLIQDLSDIYTSGSTQSSATQSGFKAASGGTQTYTQNYGSSTSSGQASATAQKTVQKSLVSFPVQTSASEVTQAVFATTTLAPASMTQFAAIPAATVSVVKSRTQQTPRTISGAMFAPAVKEKFDFLGAQSSALKPLTALKPDVVTISTPTTLTQQSTKPATIQTTTINYGGGGGGTTIITTPAPTPPPPIIIPFIPSIGFNFGGSKYKSRSSYRRSYQYNPSFVAVSLGIKGKRPNVTTGVGIRPIIK